MWLDDTVNWNRAVKRLVWGKMVNLGQVKKLKKTKFKYIIFTNVFPFSTDLRGPRLRTVHKVSL